MAKHGEVWVYAEQEWDTLQEIGIELLSKGRELADALAQSMSTPRIQAMTGISRSASKTSQPHAVAVLQTARSQPPPVTCTCYYGTVGAMRTSALTAIEISLHCGGKVSGSVGMQRKKAEPEFVLGGLQAKNFAYKNYRYCKNYKIFDFCDSRCRNLTSGCINGLNLG